MKLRVFAERLNQGLDDIGVPVVISERIDVFSKLINLPRFKAEALLNGKLMADPELIQHIAKELEVTPEWLLGEDD